MKEYNKLVRDKIPLIIRGTGAQPEVTKITGNELYKALNSKLREETEEYISAKSQCDIREELADVIEVVFAIAAFHKISVSSIMRAKKNKKIIRGGFDGATFLKNVKEKGEI